MHECNFNNVACLSLHIDPMFDDKDHISFIYMCTCMTVVGDYINLGNIVVVSMTCVGLPVIEH